MINTKILFENCQKARQFSRSQYSHFAVGAVVVLKTGELINGCNIENAAYGLCMCAERTALFSAYSRGVKKDDIEAIGIIGDTELPISPCGSCRQVMVELLNKETPVYMFNLKGDLKIMTVEELMPFSFSEGDLS
ncbi:MAG: cytidine deaminase [Bacilli bacterium]